MNSYATDRFDAVCGVVRLELGEKGVLSHTLEGSV